jgi:hypothetical protein
MSIGRAPSTSLTVAKNFHPSLLTYSPPGPMTQLPLEQQLTKQLCYMFQIFDPMKIHTQTLPQSDLAQSQENAQ